MKRSIAFTFCIILSLLAGGCSVASASAPNEETPETRPTEEMRSSQPEAVTRPVAVTQPSADLPELVDSNRRFAFNFYSEIRNRDGNLGYSPFSLSSALAMAYAGAHGQTAAQMARTLQFDLPSERLHPAFSQLLLDLKKSTSGLYISNSLWDQKEMNYQPDFLGLLERSYGAGLQTVDFAGAPELARQAVNDWVQQETRGKISDLLAPGSVNEQTRLVLASAIYFKALWQQAFSPDLTQEATFTRLDGKRVQAPMMALKEPVILPYAAGKGYQAVELPYADGSTAMVVIMPDVGSFSKFERNLDAAELAAIRSALSPTSIEITFPKFELEFDLDLAGSLSALGMPDAFQEDRADFSGMTGSRDFVLSQARQKVYISVDEMGTEAAAATGLTFNLISYQPSEIHLDVNHPFIFAILDKPTGSLLFLGRILDPTE